MVVLLTLKIDEEHGATVDGKVDRNRLSARVVHDPAAIKRLWHG
jgi:hypothetical protein